MAKGHGQQWPSKFPACGWELLSEEKDEKWSSKAERLMVTSIYLSLTCNGKSPLGVLIDDWHTLHDVFFSILMNRSSLFIWNLYMHYLHNAYSFYLLIAIILASWSSSTGRTCSHSGRSCSIQRYSSLTGIFFTFCLHLSWPCLSFFLNFLCCNICLLIQLTTAQINKVYQPS